MKKFLKGLGVAALLIPIVALHMAIAYSAPFPFNKVNIIFASLILFLLFKKSGVVVWISFFLHYLVELYSTTAFGIVLFSGTLSILILYWISKHIFTNPRFIVALGLCVSGLIAYRLIYVVALVSLHFLSRAGYPQPMAPELWLLYFWELLFTTVLVSLAYVIISFYRAKKDRVLA